MESHLVFVGIGGQGIIASSRLLARAAHNEGKTVLSFDSHSGIMRGDRCECHITISDEPILSPPLLLSFTTAVVMHDEGMALRPATSNLRFYAPPEFAARLESIRRPLEDVIEPGGLMLINSSIITHRPERDDITLISAPLNALAEEAGDVMAANMVALGALIESTRLVSLSQLLSELETVLPPHRHQLLKVNRQALEKGAEFVRSMVHPTREEFKNG